MTLINNNYSFVPLSCYEIAKCINFKAKYETVRDTRSLVATALSFLNFYSPTARCLFPVTHIISAYSGGQKVIEKFRAETSFPKKERKFPKESFLSGLNSVFSVAAAITSLVNYRRGLIISLIQDIVNNAIDLGKASDNDEISLKFAFFARNVFYLRTVLMPSPQMLAMSLALRSVSVGYQIYYRSRSSGYRSPLQKLDFAVNFIGGAVFAYQAGQQSRMANIS